MPMIREFSPVRDRARGFGLVELMAAVAVAAILLAIALPNFRELGVNTNVSSMTNELVTVMNLARSDAVRRGVKVAVISTSAGSNWSTGWSVKADTNRDGTFVTTMQSHQAIPAGYKVSTKSAGGNDGKIIFTETGALQTPTTKFDINVCRPDLNLTKSRWIQVTGQGQIRSQRNTTAGAPGSTASC